MQTLPQLRFVESLSDIPSAEWDGLIQDQPFLCHAWLHALHESGAATPETGWAPCYPTLWRDGRLVGAMPLYLKSHSYGEYVFDWAWADAYQRHGLRYYPKLLSAVPFTPVPGPRLLAANTQDRQMLLLAALGLLREDDALSSLHVLLPSAADSTLLAEEGGLRREGVQFHWCNVGYADFDDFLARMSHDKRKKIRQDRKKAMEEVHIEVRRGADISPADWRFFHRCYSHTYRMHQSTPYLDLDFFLRIGQEMPAACTLFIAMRESKPIAASFCMQGDSALHGRYWGAVEYIPCLHFELCYYRPIAYCIEQGLSRFEGGAQGEHKLSRGLDPASTLSYHWLKHEGFNDAVADFLQRERGGMALYLDELNERRPFKTTSGDPDANIG